MVLCCHRLRRHRYCHQYCYCNYLEPSSLIDYPATNGPSSSSSSSSLSSPLPSSSFRNSYRHHNCHYVHHHYYLRHHNHNLTSQLWSTTPGNHMMLSVNMTRGEKSPRFSSFHLFVVCRCRPLLVLYKTE